MIRSVVVAVTLTLGAVSPMWAQDAAKRMLEEEEEALEGVQEEELEGAQKEDTVVVREDELEAAREEELEAAREDEPEVTQEEELEGAPKEAPQPEDEETGEPAPPPPSPPPGPTFQDQLGTLIVDLRQDRASGRQYARAPERGKEALMQEVSLAIPEQLLANDCWVEEDAVIAGRRETIAIALRFDVDGRFVEEPRLVSPPEMPANDPALQRFIERTFLALRACNANGIKLPPRYFEDPIWVYFILQSRPE
jgi:hypothetical protein